MRGPDLVIDTYSALEDMEHRQSRQKRSTIKAFIVSLGKRGAYQRKGDDRLTCLLKNGHLRGKCRQPGDAQGALSEN